MDDADDVDEDDDDEDDEEEEDVVDDDDDDNEVVPLAEVMVVLWGVPGASGGSSKSTGNTTAVSLRLKYSWMRSASFCNVSLQSSNFAFAFSSTVNCNVPMGSMKDGKIVQKTKIIGLMMVEKFEQL